MEEVRVDCLRVNAVAGENEVEHFAVQDIEDNERTLAVTNSSHRRLVPCTPSIGKSLRVEVTSTNHVEEASGFAGDARTPIDHRPENIKGKHLSDPHQQFNFCGLDAATSRSVGNVCGALHRDGWLCGSCPSRRMTRW